MFGDHPEHRLKLQFQKCKSQWLNSIKVLKKQPTVECGSLVEMGREAKYTHSVKNERPHWPLCHCQVCEGKRKNKYCI
jgi:hypothetical protein